MNMHTEPSRIPARPRPRPAQPAWRHRAQHPCCWSSPCRRWDSWPCATTSREVVQSGQLVARERALLVAQAAASLAASQVRRPSTSASGGATGCLALKSIDQALAGQGSTPWDAPSAATVSPGRTTPVTATTRDRATKPHPRVGDDPIDCGGPTLHAAGLRRLPLRLHRCGDEHFRGARRPFRDHRAGQGDPEAIVTVWVRNNASDALTAAGTVGVPEQRQLDSADGDGRVTVTAMRHRSQRHGHRRRGGPSRGGRGHPAPGTAADRRRGLRLRAQQRQHQRVALLHALGQRGLGGNDGTPT